MTETNENIKLILSYLKSTIEAIEDNELTKAQEYFETLMNSGFINLEVYDAYSGITDALETVSVYLSRKELGLKVFYDPDYLWLSYRELENEVREKQQPVVQV